MKRFPIGFALVLFAACSADSKAQIIDLRPPPKPAETKPAETKPAPPKSEKGAEEKPTEPKPENTPATTVSTPESLAGFKAKATEFAAWVVANDFPAAKEPADGVTKLAEQIKRMKEISTDGVPEDIVVPWDSVKLTLGKLSSMTSDLLMDKASNAAAWQKLLEERSANDAQFKAKVDQAKTRMVELLKALDLMRKAVAESAGKHGIPLEWGAPVAEKPKAE